MINFEDGMSLDELIAENRILIVEYGSFTCAPCNVLRCKIEAWSRNKKMVCAVYIDVEKYKKISAQQGILSAPTILVYVDGHLAIRDSGYFSLELLFDGVNRNIEMLGD